MVAVKPVKVKRLPAFLAAVEPIARDLADGDIFAALAHHADKPIEATAIGTGVERAWLEEQDVDSLVDLAVQVLEANGDFFVRRVLPKVTAAAENLARIGSGGTSGLPGSVPPDSATPT